MNKAMRLLSTILLILVTGGMAAAQTKKVAIEMKKAERDFDLYCYISAIGHLKKVVALDIDNIKAQEMLAFSYMQIRAYTQALDAYEKVCARPDVKAESALHFAEALAIHQQYERSEQWYRKYLRLAPQDRRAKALARQNLPELVKQNDTWQVYLSNINTAAAEYSPVFFRGGLLFCSNRIGRGITSRVFPWDNTPYTKLYFVSNTGYLKEDSHNAEGKQGKKRKGYYIFNDDNTEATSNDSKIFGYIDEPFLRAFPADYKETFKIARRIRGAINNGYHTGPVSVFPDGSLIFTRSNYYNGKIAHSKDGTTKLSLFTATGKRLNRIKPFLYNSDEYSTGHPTVSKDGSILIFASDMPGGYGGTDLYYCVRSGTGEWTRPINLGKQINTEGNEQFPFLAKDDMLYFASNGHAGFGGLDLFTVKLKEMKPVETPKNMGAPVNSSFDDFGLTLNEEMNEGYFSSNRSGNDNIYHLQRTTKQIVLAGTVKDRLTKLPLGGSLLILKTLDGPDTLKTDAQGKYTKILAPETDYSIAAQKVGYVYQASFFSTVGVEKDSTVKADFLLSKTDSKQGDILRHCDSLKQEYKVENIYYDLDRSEIRPDAKPALDKLVLLMNKYPEINVITSSHCDSRASDMYNRILSMRRGEAARNYLISHGINGTRVHVEYYGKSRLLNKCQDPLDCPESAQQMNRRTEFDIILHDVNITQLDCDTRD